MPAPKYSDSKDKLIEGMRASVGSGDRQFDIAKAFLDVKNQEDIAATVAAVGRAVSNFRKSVEEISQRSDQLSRRLFWLNVILATATVVGAIATTVLAAQAF